MSEQTRTKLLGDLGEYLVAWYLRSRYNLEVSLSKSEGIDILVSDSEGRFFDSRDIAAINVKTRERNSKNFDDSVNIEWDKLEEKARRWKATPFIAYVRIAPDVGKITCYLTSLTKARKYSKGNNFNVRRADKDQGNILFTMNFPSYRKIR